MNSVTAKNAHDRQTKIITVKRGIEGAFLILGGLLSEFERREDFKSLGYEYMSSWLASPEVDISAGSCSISIKVYRVFIELHGIKEDLLVEAGISKLYMLSQHVNHPQTAVDVNEWVVRASTLSRSSFRQALLDEFNRPFDRFAEDTAQQIAYANNLFYRVYSRLDDLLGEHDPLLLELKSYLEQVGKLGD